MKRYATTLILVAWATCSLSLPAAVFKQAEVTRVLNDVRVLPDQASPAAARIGDVINGKTAVATGAQSRAELRFPDKTLTRLGANTLFRLEEGTRDIDLERGVLMLQVPKQLGGARVRTAAVTAAVTGTTIMVEYQPDGYIKVIVIEGELDLYLRESPSTFINLKAGDMILMKPDAKSFPQPVKVDLERLLATSKLLDEDEFGPVGNDKEIADALSDQGEKKNEGELQKTAFMLPGRGTRVTLTNEVRRELLRFQQPTPPNTSKPPPQGGSGGGNPGGPGVVPRAPIIRPYNPGTTIITDNDPIVTNPHLTAFNLSSGQRTTAQGFFYNPAVDGPYGPVIFNQQGTQDADALVAAAGLWAAFHFENLSLTGNPSINSTTGARNLLLAAEANLSLQRDFFFGESESSYGGSGMLTLGSSLDNLLLASNTGSIEFDSSFKIQAEGNQGILLQTFGPQSDILFYGYFGEDVLVDAPQGKFQANAARDVVVMGANLQADSVTLNGKRDVIIEQGAEVRANSKIEINAAREIKVESSSELLALTEGGLQEMVLKAGGNFSIIDSYLAANDLLIESQTGNLTFTRSGLGGDVIRARALSANGQLLIDGAIFSADAMIRLYAEGSNGQIRFISNSTLDASKVDLAAKTVTINSGVDVEVSNPTGLRVFTDTANFDRPSAPNASYGRFTNDSSMVDVTPQAFGNRPGFNAP